MELKDFISETIRSIVDASSELNRELSDIGIVVNPPLTSSERDEFDPGSCAQPIRRVTEVEFDVAITASSEANGGGSIGLKVLSAEVGLQGGGSKLSEQVSRVKFIVPVSSALSDLEATQQNRHDDRMKQINTAVSDGGPKFSMV